MSAWQMLAATVIPGLLGGAMSAVADALALLAEAPARTAGTESSPGRSLQEKAFKSAWFYMGRSFMGVGGAAGVILAGIWSKRIDFEPKADSVALLVCLCLVGGFFARTVLALVGRRLEEEVLKQRVARVEEQGKEAAAISNSNAEYTKAIASAQAALLHGQTADVREAITELQAIESRFSCDRLLHIYLGRLHAENKDYDAAIKVLRNLVDNLRATAGPSLSEKAAKDASDAYYNIACYQSIRAKAISESHAPREEVERLKKEALESLKLGLQESAENRGLARTDKDLDFIRDDAKGILEGA